MKNSSMKLTFIITPLMVVLVLGSYFYSLWAAEVKRRDEMPQDGAAALSRDLLKYHEQTGTFPEELRPLVGKVWDTKKKREFDQTGKVFQHGKVFYLYARHTPHSFSLWAVPSGERREEGISWYILASPDAIRRWKGPAIPDNQVEKLMPAPSVQLLALLGLTEQPPISLRKTNGANNKQPAKIFQSNVLSGNSNK
ncbi:MAG: hypothetical protein M3367_19695 [Acidobacteriota bacterium]|nr:hypothetical protein [Acidobacteriota bacterium]